MTIHHINPYDFSWMNKGSHLETPTHSDLILLQPYEAHHRTEHNSALLLLHGFGSSPAVFRKIYTHSLQYDYVVSPCLIGHGSSIADFAKATAHGWMTQTQNMMSDLCRDYKYVDVMGLSLGGLLACHLAQRFPISKLFLLAPALALNTSPKLLLKIARLAKTAGFYSIYNRGGQTFKRKTQELLYRQLPLDVLIEILIFIMNYQHQSWSHPTTLFIGQHDKVIHSNRVASILANLPNLETHVLGNSGHVLPIEEDYKQILQALQKTNHQS